MQAFVGYRDYEAQNPGIKTMLVSFAYQEAQGRAVQNCRVSACSVHMDLR